MLKETTVWSQPIYLQFERKQTKQNKQTCKYFFLTLEIHNGKKFANVCSFQHPDQDKCFPAVLACETLQNITYSEGSLMLYVLQEFPEGLAIPRSQNLDLEATVENGNCYKDSGLFTWKRRS